MSKPARFDHRKKLTLQGERLEIAAAHVYAKRKSRTLSALFFSWMNPKVEVDKVKLPTAYTPEALEAVLKEKGAKQ